jgi:hypothetical protein
MARQFKPGQLQTGSLYNISASYSITASYAINSGATIDTGSLVTTSSFNAFTASYTTGSFTGSFSGNGSGLTGITSASYATTAAVATSASYAASALSSSFATTASFALTASYASIAPITVGTTPILSGVQGRVLFEGSGNVVQEDAGLFWDNVNKRLGVGATPNTSTRLDVRAQGALSTDVAFRVRNSADTKNILKIQGDGNAYLGEETDSGVKSFFINTYNNPRLVLDTGYSTDTGIISITRRYHGTIGVYNDNTLLLSHNSFSDGNIFAYKMHFVNPSTYYGLLGSNGYNAGFMWHKDSAIVSNLQMKLSPDNALSIYTSSASPLESVITGSGFQLWASGSLGNAAPHFRTQNGNIVKLYSQAAVTSSQGIADALTNLGFLTGSSVIANPSPFPYTGSAFITGSLTITGSLNVSGSTTQIGNNTLLGNTILSGSLNISGNTTMTGSLTALNSTASFGYVSASFLDVTGKQTVKGYLQFYPTADVVPITETGSYIYSSGSEGDMYFAQTNGSINNIIRLRWLEGNMYSGLLNGGIISTQSSTVFQVSSGSGLIVSLNGSLNSDPYPAVQYLNWPTLSSSIAPLSASFDQSFVAIEPSGSQAIIFVQGIPFDDGQFNTMIPIGNVIHQNRSTINATATYPSVAYGYKQRSSDFIRAFGPLKLSGLNTIVSGSTTGSLQITSGTSYNEGRNYVNDVNNPSYVTDTGQPISKIFRYYQSGSSWVYLTNGGAGFTTIDPTKYSLNGVLTPVPGTGANREYSIQRIYYFPGGATKGIYVYYGNTTYPSAVSAIANIPYEDFTEAPNTAAGAVLSAYLVVRNNANFTIPESFNIRPGGLFRNIGGSGGGGSAATQTLSSLTDVNVLTPPPTDGQPLAYNGTTLKWENRTYISASLAGNAATATSASYALTASYLDNYIPPFPYTGSALITGSLGVTGSLTTRAQGALSTDIAFRVRNSADSANIFQVNGIGNAWSNGGGFIASNTAYGQGALNVNTSGSGNTAFGGNASVANTTGFNNVSFGFEALRNNVTGAYNTAVGYGSLKDTFGIGYNTAIGWGTGIGLSSGYGNTFLGYAAGSGITTGNNNTVIGVNIATLASSTTNNVILADGGGNIALRKDANHFVGIGYSATATLAAKLDIKAQGALSTDIAFRVRNSSDNYSIITARGDRSISFFADSQGINFTQPSLGTAKIRHYAVATLPSHLTIQSDGAGGSVGQIRLDAFDGNTPAFTVQRLISGLSDLTGATLYSGFGTNAATFVMKNALNYGGAGIIPTGTAVDHFAMYSADITAGNAAPHFRTENGSVIKLYKQDLPTNPTNAELATFLSNLGLANLI